MTIGDICNRTVVVAPKTETIVDAAKRMRTSHVGDLVIVEPRNARHVPIGIVTDRDIVISVVAGDPDAFASPALRVCSPYRCGSTPAPRERTPRHVRGDHDAPERTR